MEFILLLILGLVIYWFIRLHNRIVPMSERCKSLSANITTEEYRKTVTFERFLEMVSTGSEFEKSLVLEAARIRTNSKMNLDEKIETITRLIGGGESNPNAIAINLFQNFQKEIAETENRIQSSKKDFNVSAQILNSTIRLFPNNIACGLMKINVVEYFKHH
ncbi:LemA family protein [Polynucleobacter paneuropaeus]|jgi:LemA protein|nr:LemA family protein [Polynucleobacter paneuropaeus]